MSVSGPLGSCKIDPAQKVSSCVQPQPGRAETSCGERSQIHLHDQPLPAELKELVKTDNVDEVRLVQATIRVPAHFEQILYLILTMST